MKNPLPGLLAAVGLLVSAPAAAQQNLIVNGSFETPVVTAGSFSDFLTGSTAIPGWTVFGDPGKGVSIVSGTFVDRIAFPAQDGAQWLDLTGNGFNSETQGLAQTVATVPGHRYQLSYYIGNVTDPEQVYGTTSAVTVLVNGTPVATDVNSMTGTTRQVWQQFTRTLFTATAATTTVGFRNADTPCTCDQHNGLDHIVLIDLDAEPVAQAVPAPALSPRLVLLLVALLGWIGYRRAATRR